MQFVFAIIFLIKCWQYYYFVVTEQFCTRKKRNAT